MRYLRQQVLNRRAPYDQRLYVDMTDSIVMNSTNNMLVPKGNGSTNRPVSPVNGMVRYNTTINQLEAYQANVWRSISFKESTKIIQQTLGPIDGYSYFYGPLNSSYDPINVSSNNDNFGGQNILVFVGNVFQIWNTNYIITQNPTAVVATSTITNSGETTLTFASTATIPTGSVVSGSARFQSNTIATVTNGTTVTLDKATTGGTIASGTSITFTSTTGYYLNFTSDAQYSGLPGQSITVLHGFDR